MTDLAALLTDELTPIERIALREVLAGLREVEGKTGYGNVTLFMRDGEVERVTCEWSKKVSVRG